MSTGGVKINGVDIQATESKNKAAKTLHFVHPRYILASERLSVIMQQPLGSRFAADAGLRMKSLEQKGSVSGLGSNAMLTGIVGLILTATASIASVLALGPSMGIEGFTEVA